MTYIPKPKVHHPALGVNQAGLSRRAYEGQMSTLCAGCGHDSVTAAIVDAFWRLSIPPHRVAKLSGIGCSAKTPTYFLGAAHGFNAVHGRMPSIAAGANAAHRGLYYIGVSGDGDSLSIGLGQMAHAIRRNVNMLYVLENNGVYGLTKGQFSASADLGTHSKGGEINAMPPIDPVLLALSLGATFVARSFSGDKKQLVPIIEAGIRHHGLALIDVVSPCVTFNDHQGSTKSYRYTRENTVDEIEADFVPQSEPITAEYDPGRARDVTLHDGSVIRFRKVPADYDPTDRDAAYAYVRERQKAGEVPTGLLHIDTGSADMHSVLGTVETPLVELHADDVCPGKQALGEILQAYR